MCLGCAADTCREARSPPELRFHLGDALCDLNHTSSTATAGTIRSDLPKRVELQLRSYA